MFKLSQNGIKKAKMLQLCVGNIIGQLPFFLLLSCEGSMIAQEILKVFLA